MRVLVVDDNAVNRLIASCALRRLGFVEVLEAADGMAAITCAASQHLDLVLLDVHMPGLDGAATFERLRADEETAGIPVVFFTAGDTGRLRRLGAEGTISKPAEPQLLAQAVVDVAVGAWRSRRRAAPAPAPTPTPVTGSASTRSRVLVADDNEYWRDLFECTLATMFDVRTVHDGRAAVRVAEEWLPDAVLLDVAMPELAGNEAADRLRRVVPGAPPKILGFSADDPTPEQRAAFDDFVLKPVRSHELVRRLVKVLRPEQGTTTTDGRST